jgi:hypothetical protein
MMSVGRIIDIYGRWKPDLIVVDGGGMGAPIYDRLQETGIFRNLVRFDGARTQTVKAVRHRNPGNERAEGYLLLDDWVDSGWLKLGEDHVIRQLEQIKIKHTSAGKIYIESKKDMKGRGIHSPDDADSLMMAVWGAVKHLGQTNKRNTETVHSGTIRRISNRKGY